MRHSEGSDSVGDVGGGCAGGGGMVVVVGVVKKRRPTTTTFNTATTTNTIPQRSIQIDKFFLSISATLKKTITYTTVLPLPSIPY